MVKHLPTMRKTQVQSLGWEDPLEKEIPVLLLGKSHGWRSVVDYSLWGRKESDTTEWLSLTTFSTKVLFIMMMPYMLLFMSDSLRSHELQHTRLPSPSLSPGVCSNSCPLSWWCYLTISSSMAPFSFCLQSFPASGSFPGSQLFTSGLELQHQSFQWISLIGLIA